MKTMNEWKEIAGVFSLEKITPEYRYYAYKNGEAEIFDSWQDARQFSELIEKTMVNKEDVEAYKIVLQQKSQLAFDMWYQELKEEFANDYPKLLALSTECFGVIYSKAYDRGHSAGYDEVASYFKDEAYYLENAFETCGIL